MAPRTGGNDIPSKAKPFLDKIEGLFDEIESLKSDFMTACKKRRELIREHYKAAKDKGIPVESLKGIIKQRALQDKIDKIPVDFDIDEAAAYRDLAEAFGPLGQSAAIGAGYGDANGSGQTAAEAEAAQKQRDHEAGLQTVGRGPVTS